MVGALAGSEAMLSRLSAAGGAWCSRSLARPRPPLPLGRAWAAGGWSWLAAGGGSRRSGAAAVCSSSAVWLAVTPITKGRALLGAASTAGSWIDRRSGTLRSPKNWIRWPAVLARLSPGSALWAKAGSVDNPELAASRPVGPESGVLGMAKLLHALGQRYRAPQGPTMVGKLWRPSPRNRR